jgi:phosphopantetheine--protein transferase-like protein
MEEKIKKIIAVFLKKEVSEITTSTYIDQTAIASSILIHRMYGELAKAGFGIKNYMNIHTYGQLINQLNGNNDLPIVSQISEPVVKRTGTSAISGVGIDMEKLSNFTPVNDYREEPFYSMNFSAKEISYCILKSNPIESFAGLFCLKEALCKIDDNLRKTPFNQIEISHTPEGKPYYAGYLLSVSHTADTAIGIAIK